MLSSGDRSETHAREAPWWGQGDAALLPAVGPWPWSRGVAVLPSAAVALDGAHIIAWGESQPCSPGLEPPWGAP